MGTRASRAWNQVPIILAQSGAGFVTPADTTEDVLATVTVPANTLGANGRLRIRTWWTMTSSANTKTIRIRWNGAAGSQVVAGAYTTVASAWADAEITNRAATNSQTYMGLFAASAASPTVNISTASIDTTAAVDIVFTGQKASSGETLRLESYTVEYLKP